MSLRSSGSRYSFLRSSDAVVGQDLAVPRIGRLAAEDDRPAVAAAQDLVEQGQLHLTIAGATEMRPEMGGPQAPLPDLLLQRRDELLADRVLHVPGVVDHEVERLDLLPHERLDPIEFLLELGLGLEIPTHAISFWRRPTGGGRRRRRAPRTRPASAAPRPARGCPAETRPGEHGRGRRARRGRWCTARGRPGGPDARRPSTSRGGRGRTPAASALPSCHRCGNRPGARAGPRRIRRTRGPRACGPWPRPRTRRCLDRRRPAGAGLAPAITPPSGSGRCRAAAAST